VRLAEAPSFGKPIILYDVASIGAQAYLQVAQELMARTVAGAAANDGIGMPAVATPPAA
jgi:chromosome partitioning protein